jgi:hypothetical protein
MEPALQFSTRQGTYAYRRNELKEEKETSGEFRQRKKG